MAQAAPSISLPHLPAPAPRLRSAAWGVAWTVVTPAIRLLGRVLASEYANESGRAGVPADRRPH